MYFVLMARQNAHQNNRKGGKINGPRFQLSEDTWAYVDKERSKLIVEIDLPNETNNNQSLKQETIHHLSPVRNEPIKE